MTSAVWTRRNYSYQYRGNRKTWRVASTRDEWLDAILAGNNKPKPPTWWIKQQVLEGRAEKSAAIVWNMHYDTARKYTIWSQASDEDFAAGGYM